MLTTRACSLRSGSTALALFVLSRAAAGQCPPQWLDGAAVDGFNGPVNALCTLPNGDILAGGSFSVAGGSSAALIARWTGDRWATVGPSLAGNVVVGTLAIAPNGDIIAGGILTSVGGVPVNGITRWDGTAWRPFGSGVSFRVNAIAFLPGGDLIAGGLFGTAGGIPANNIARWNGSAWSALGGGFDANVEALAVLPGGDLIAAGAFTYVVGGPTVDYIARWNGSTWSVMPGGGANGQVRCLAVMPNGDLVVGGLFTDIGSVGASHIARWNGSQWSALGQGVTTPGGSANVESLAVLPNGDLVAGGLFLQAGGVPASYVARWDGAVWSALGAGTTSDVVALAALPGGDFAAGGSFRDNTNHPSSYFARYAFAPTGPRIIAQPSATTACANTPATFSVGIIGAAPTSYNWQVESPPGTWTTLGYGSTPLPCGGLAQGSFPSPSSAAISVTPCPGFANCRVRCLISTSCGSATTDPVEFVINTADFNDDGDSGTDADIEAFFACLAGDCCPACGSADFNGDGDVGTDADIEAFFRVLAGGAC